MEDIIMTQDNSTKKDKRFAVHIDKDLEDLIPGYIENRQKDIISIRNALEKSDFESIRILGHSMKGSGGGYGFDEITRIGASLETTAKDKDAEAIKQWTEKLSFYINNIDITYD